MCARAGASAHSLPPSSSAFCSLPSAQRSRNLTEASQREGRGFDLFFPVIPSSQIKGRFVFKLTKSSGGPRQRANIVKCLSRSICVMAELSVTVCTRACVCMCTDLLLPPLHPPLVLSHSVPAITANFYFGANYYCFLIIPLYYGWAVQSTGQRLPFRCSTLFRVKFLLLVLLSAGGLKEEEEKKNSLHITMETTRFHSPRGSIKHFYSEDLFMCQWKGGIWHLRALVSHGQSFFFVLKALNRALSKERYDPEIIKSSINRLKMFFFLLCFV